MYTRTGCIEEAIITTKNNSVLIIKDMKKIENIIENMSDNMIVAIAVVAAVVTVLGNAWYNG